jgi:hypothetical protein
LKKDVNRAESGQEGQGRCPPDATGQLNHGIGPPENLSRAGQNAHLFEGLRAGEIQSPLDPLPLERLETKAAPRENALETPREFAAGTAIAVEEDPAPGKDSI